MGFSPRCTVLDLYSKDIGSIAVMLRILSYIVR